MRILSSGSHTETFNFGLIILIGEVTPEFIIKNFLVVCTSCMDYLRLSGRVALCTRGSDVGLVQKRSVPWYQI